MNIAFKQKRPRPPKLGQTPDPPTDTISKPSIKKKVRRPSKPRVAKPSKPSPNPEVSSPLSSSESEQLPPATAKRKRNKSRVVKKRPRALLLTDEDIVLQSACDFVDQVMQNREQKQKQSSKGHWSLSEDLLLCNAIKCFGGVPKGRGGWRAVATHVDGREAKQCRERFCNHLDENIAEDSMEGDEKQLLRWLYWFLGPSWSKIAELINQWRQKVGKIGRRTDNKLKNTCNTTIRHAFSGDEVKLPDSVGDDVVRIVTELQNDHKTKSVVCRSVRKRTLEQAKEPEVKLNRRSGLNMVRGATMMDGYKKQRNNGLTFVATVFKPLPERTVLDVANCNEKVVFATVVRVRVELLAPPSLEKAFEEAKNDTLGDLLLQALGGDSLLV